MPAVSRKSRLDKLARALQQSRVLVDAAVQDQVGDDLFSSWCEGNIEPLVSLVRYADGSLPRPLAAIDRLVQRLLCLKKNGLRKRWRAQPKTIRRVKSTA